MLGAQRSVSHSSWHALIHAMFQQWHDVADADRDDDDDDDGVGTDETYLSANLTSAKSDRGFEAGIPD